MSDLRFRERKELGKDLYLGRSWITISGDTLVSYQETNPYLANVIMYSDQCYDRTNPGPPYRSGGGFYVAHIRNALDDVQNSGYWVSDPAWPEPGHIAYHYEGGFAPTFMDISPYVGDMWNFGDPSSYGASAWKKFKPKTSTSDLAQFLAELKDLPRMLKTTSLMYRDLWRASGGSKTKFGPKSVASNWLNTQFGWIPFVNDMINFYETTTNLDKRLEKVRKNNNRWIRRGGSVTIPETSDVELLYNPNSPYLTPMPSTPLLQYINGTLGEGRITLSTNKRAWFEAAYKYYIATNYDSPATARIFDILREYGFRVSPSLIWELTPWSWLVDYFSNIGDIITNLSSMILDNLVTKYAYIMCSAERTLKNQSTLNMITGPLNFSWESTVTTKARKTADPFGFDISWENFSPRQLSILLALGVTRA